MMRQRTYLDYNATAPLRPAARHAMLAAMDAAGNPSSVHAEGRRARAIIEDARETIAGVIGARPSEIVFTSGAAEANATVLAADWDLVAAARLEHESVLAALGARSGDARLELPTTDDGVVDLSPLAAPQPAGGGTSRGLLTLQIANNETGVVQPVARAAALARDRGLHVHCDAVQGLGRMPLDFAGLGLDFMSLSAHKIGGPKGIGALVAREGVPLLPLIAGGQERRRRGGTENVVAIAGFAAAAAEAARDMHELQTRLSRLRDDMEDAFRAAIPGVTIVGATAPRLANTSCLAVPGHLAETLVIRLDLMGLAVSAGAACSSGKVGASHVLAAMGLPAEVARGAIRVSLGRETQAADVERFIAAIHEIGAGADRIRKLG